MMYENLQYELLYFKELHNEQEYYWPAIRTQSGGSSSVNYYKLVLYYVSSFFFTKKEFGKRFLFIQILARRS